MLVNKLRVQTDDNGLVPAGEYFKRLAAALRAANEDRDRAEARARCAGIARRQAPAQAERQQQL